MGNTSSHPHNSRHTPYNQSISIPLFLVSRAYYMFFDHLSINSWSEEGGHPFIHTAHFRVTNCRIGSLVHRLKKKISSTDICQALPLLSIAILLTHILWHIFPLFFLVLLRLLPTPKPCYTSFLPIPFSYWTVPHMCTALLIPIFDHHPYCAAMTHTFPICPLFLVLFLLVTIPIFPIGSLPLFSYQSLSHRYCIVLHRCTYLFVFHRFLHVYKGLTFAHCKTRNQLHSKLTVFILSFYP